MKKNFLFLMFLFASCTQKEALAAQVVSSEIIICNTSNVNNPDLVVCTKNGLHTRPPEHMHFALHGEKCETVKSVNEIFEDGDTLSDTGVLCKDSVIKNATFKK